MIHSEHQVKGVLDVINAIRDEVARRCRRSTTASHEYKILTDAERLFVDAGKANSEGDLFGAERAGAQAIKLIEQLDEDAYATYKEAIRSLVVL